MNRTLLCLGLATASFVGCARVHDAWRFFFTHCPADGPVRESELEIHLEPVDLTTYYRDLRSASEGLSVRELALVSANGATFPIYQIGPLGRSPSHRILVVAGVHGNEVAASLAAPRILRDAREQPALYDGCELHLIAPANPVGLANQSRYQANGCDVNRDFGAFRTPEAQAVRAAFERLAPTLVVALHEGPQDGFYVIATRATPASIPEAVANSLRTAGVPLSSDTLLGTRLRDAGYEHEGRATTILKQLIRLESLGTYANGLGVGTLTTESPWTSRDLPSRIEAQVLAVRAACAEVRRHFGSGT